MSTYTELGHVKDGLMTLEKGGFVALAEIEYKIKRVSCVRYSTVYSNCRLPMALWYWAGAYNYVYSYQYTGVNNSHGLLTIRFTYVHRHKLT